MLRGARRQACGQGDQRPTTACRVCSVRVGRYSEPGATGTQHAWCKCIAVRVPHAGCRPGLRAGIGPELLLLLSLASVIVRGSQ
eukprot:13482132-Alexandrium_andersonii.AAC.1